MTTQIFAAILDSGDTADFKATGQNMCAALDVVMTRVITTGDINWNTATGTTATSQYRGFQVYRITDSLHATHPLYFKIEFGSNGLSASYYGLRVTVAKSVDSAGVMTNILFGPTEVLKSSTNNVPTASYATNGGESGIAFSIAPSIPEGGSVFILERARDAVGNIIGDAFYLGYKTNMTDVWINRFYDYATGTYNNIAGGIGCIPISLAADVSLANSTITPYFPVACISPGGTYWIPRMVLAGARADCALASVITSLFDSGNYIGLGPAGQKYDQRGSAYSSLMLRWD